MIGQVIYANKGVHNQKSYSIRLVGIHAYKDVHNQSVIWLVGILYANIVMDGVLWLVKCERVVNVVLIYFWKLQDAMKDIE